MEDFNENKPNEERAGAFRVWHSILPFALPKNILVLSH